MNSADIRCSNDEKMFQKLVALQDVVKANEFLKKQADNTSSPIRRHLLSKSVRLSKKMAPKIHKMAEHCIEKLGVKIPLELFVYSSPQFNAACFKPEDNKLYIMFSSSLLQGFNEKELMFVMGHELGHHVYEHHNIPVGLLLKGEHKVSSKLALDLFAWSRYAEISADRAGAHCAQDPVAVASSLFKLASGLTNSSLIEFDLNEFVKQVDEMMVDDQTSPLEGSSEDWFSTHPFSPLRVKALQLFEQSVLSTRGQSSVEELEVKVQSLMSLMEPSYLQAKTDEAEIMRRFLLSGAVAVANANGDISKREIEAFENFFGKGAFSDKLNVEGIVDRLERRAADVTAVSSMARRMQLIRDLCVIAQADKSVSKKERTLLNYWVFQKYFISLF